MAFIFVWFRKICPTPRLKTYPTILSSNTFAVYFYTQDLCSQNSFLWLVCRKGPIQFTYILMSVPVGHRGLWIQCYHCTTGVAALVQVRSLAWEHPPTSGAAQRTKPNQTKTQSPFRRSDSVSSRLWNSTHRASLAAGDSFREVSWIHLTRPFCPVLHVGLCRLAPC